MQDLIWELFQHINANTKISSIHEVVEKDLLFAVDNIKETSKTKVIWPSQNWIFHNRISHANELSQKMNFQFSIYDFFD